MGLEAGAQVGPYRIKGPLGRGGMAAVYTAYEASLDRDVALKVLPAEFLHDPSFAERFNREARVIARLEHPNIIPIYAFGIDEGRRLPWMAMRLIPGGALSSLLKRGRLPYDRVLAILHGVAEALGYAHEHGVVHRDVKPQNILLDQAERVYLADFGIAKMLESGGGLTQTGMITGTPQYMAPEQATATTVDHRADIYAVGIVAYEMFTGRVPFAADTPVAVLMKQVSEPLPRPAPEEVPEAVVEAILCCTAKRPDDRWPTTRQFVRALEDALAHPLAPVGPSASQAVTAPFDPRATLQSAPTAEAQPGWEATAVSPRTVRGAELASTHPGSRTGTAPGIGARTSPPTSVGRRSGTSPALIIGAVLGGGALLVIAVAIGVIVWMRQGDTPQPAASESPRMAQVSPPFAPGEPTPPPATFPPATRPPATEPDATRPTSPRVPPATTPARPEPTSPTRPPETQPPRPVETPPPVAPAGPSSEVRELLAQLRQGRRDERVQAALGLGSLRREPAFAVPALAEALRDRNEDLRLRAAEALGKFGADAKPAVGALVEALDGPDLVAAEAAKSLGKLGAAAAAAASPLAGALSRSDVGLRREAARALAKLGPLASATVEALAEALQRDRDKVVRQQVADALGAIGPPARGAVPALRQASGDKDDILARKARAALEKIGDDGP